MGLLAGRPSNAVRVVQLLVAAAVAAARRSIACVGDSITLGQYGTEAFPANTFPVRLAARLQDEPLVENLGVNGATVASYASTPQHTALLRRTWDVAVVMFGTNEAISYRGQLGASDSSAGSCATDLACVYASHYGQLISAIRAVHANTTILLMIPPQTFGSFPKVGVLRQLVPAIAAAHELAPPIDLYSKLEGTPLPPRCPRVGGGGGCRFFCDDQFCDQLHPNEVGYDAIAAAVADALVLAAPPTSGTGKDDGHSHLPLAGLAAGGAVAVVAVVAVGYSMFNNKRAAAAPGEGAAAPRPAAAASAMAVATLQVCTQGTEPKLTL